MADIDREVKPEELPFDQLAADIERGIDKKKTRKSREYTEEEKEKLKEHLAKARVKALEVRRGKAEVARKAREVSERLKAEHMTRVEAAAKILEDKQRAQLLDLPAPVAIKEEKTDVLPAPAAPASGEAQGQGGKGGGEGEVQGGADQGTGRGAEREGGDKGEKSDKQGNRYSRRRFRRRRYYYPSSSEDSSSDSEGEEELRRRRRRAQKATKVSDGADGASIQSALDAEMRAATNRLICGTLYGM